MSNVMRKTERGARVTPVEIEPIAMVMTQKGEEGDSYILFSDAYPEEIASMIADGWAPVVNVKKAIAKHENEQ